MAVVGISNTELAKRVGVSPRTVGKWRRGDVTITLGSLSAVARVLEREPAWFLVDHEQVAA